MGSIPDDKIEEILERVDIIDLISRYVTLKRVGKNYFGLCPFHSEKTPSFSVSPDKQLYHCFGCGASGNAITFLMEMEGLSFTEAVKELADMTGVNLVFSRKEKETELQKNNIQEVLKFAEEFFIKNLDSPEGIEARKYLEQRGITEKTIREWKIGYAPEGWNELRSFLRKKKISDRLSEEAGLIISGREGYYDRFRGRIIFPIYDQRNRLIGFGGRIVQEASNSPKYLNSPETPLFIKSRTLFGLNIASSVISRTGEVFLVEGYLDVISLWQNGIKNSVAPLGTGLTEEQVRILSRLADKVFLAFDGDEAGIKASIRAIELLASLGIEHFVLRLPLGEDPDSFVKKKGQDGWEKVKEESVPGFDFYVDFYKSRYGASPEGIAKSAGVVARLISRIEDPVLRDVYLQRASELLGVKEESLAAKIISKEQPNEDVATKNKKQVFGFYPEEELFISFILNSPDFVRNNDLGQVREWIISPILLEIFEKWIGLVKEGKDSPGLIFDKENDKLVTIVAELQANGVKIKEEQVTELLLRMRERKLRLLQQKLSKEISLAEKRGDKEKIFRLLEEKKEILAKMRSGWSGGSGEFQGKT